MVRTFRCRAGTFPSGASLLEYDGSRWRRFFEERSNWHPAGWVVVDRGWARTLTQSLQRATLEGKGPLATGYWIEEPPRIFEEGL